jgi:hypothetical protein
MVICTSSFRPVGHGSLGFDVEEAEQIIRPLLLADLHVK